MTKKAPKRPVKKVTPKPRRRSPKRVPLVTAGALDRAAVLASTPEDPVVALAAARKLHADLTERVATAAKQLVAVRDALAAISTLLEPQP